MGFALLCFLNLLFGVRLGDEQGCVDCCAVHEGVFKCERPKRLEF
jgi:hypothetical protein